MAVKRRWPGARRRWSKQCLWHYQGATTPSFDLYGHVACCKLLSGLAGMILAQAFVVFIQVYAITVGIENDHTRYGRRDRFHLEQYSSWQGSAPSMCFPVPAKSRVKCCSGYHRSSPATGPRSSGKAGKRPWSLFFHMHVFIHSLMHVDPLYSSKYSNFLCIGVESYHPSAANVPVWCWAWPAWGWNLAFLPLLYVIA